MRISDWSSDVCSSDLILEIIGLFAGYTSGNRSGILNGMDISTMEPMLPEAAVRDLEDSTATLLAEASALAGRIHPLLRESVGALVRSMNCYYSNQIGRAHV